MICCHSPSLQFTIQMQAFVTTVYVLFFFNFDCKAEKMLIWSHMYSFSQNWVGSGSPGAKVFILTHFPAFCNVSLCCCCVSCYVSWTPLDSGQRGTCKWPSIALRAGLGRSKGCMSHSVSFFSKIVNGKVKTLELRYKTKNFSINSLLFISNIILVITFLSSSIFRIYVFLFNFKTKQWRTHLHLVPFLAWISTLAQIRLDLLLYIHFHLFRHLGIISCSTGLYLDFVFDSYS